MFLETPYGPVHFTLAEQMEYPARFFGWIQRNWHVYQAFVDLAQEGHRRGLRQWSAKAIFEVIRWQTAIRQEGEPVWKLNNNYTPGLAKLAMRQFPELRGFFRVRDGLGYDQQCA